MKLSRTYPTSIGAVGSRGGVVGLDLLRGLAALEVFLGHIRGGSFVEFGALPADEKSPIVALAFIATRLGQEAVIVFFVLSGYLVGGQVIRHVVERRFDVLSYGIDRTTRIFLPLVPACILTAAVIWFLTGHVPASVDVILNAIGFGGVFVDPLLYNAPLWSLAYEIWFYVVAGAVGCLLCEGRRLAAFLVLIGALSVFTVLSSRYLMFWAVGAMAVFLLNVRPKGPVCIAGALIALIGVLGYQLGSDTKSFTAIHILSPALSDLLICAGVALAIPYLSDPSTNAKLRPIGSGALYLSSISYSLYLFHYPLERCREILSQGLDTRLACAF